MSITVCNLQISMSNISVRFLIDKEQKRVLFAEAGSDFIDVLFSFLTLPLGSIVWLLWKKSVVSGSLGNLYKSLEQLDDNHFQTEDCKEILLNPRSAAAEICKDLMIKNIQAGNLMVSYKCNDGHSSFQSTYDCMYVRKGRCGRCRKQMNELVDSKNEMANNVGVFVDGGASYIITDDLRVIPTSLTSGFSLVEELRSKALSDLEERVIDICSEKALNLLWRSLVSKCALTEICFPHESIEEQSAKSFSAIKREIDNSEAEQKINIKIVLNKNNNNVLYAEVGGDFLNQLFSFLTFPLGSVFRLFGDDMPTNGCISNLYSSAESLNLECFKSEKYKNMVVCPQLASCYGCRKQLLKLDEMTSTKWTSPESHGLRKPKLENGDRDSGGGYVKCSRRFLVFDNLHIAPLSAISAIKGVNFPISDLVVEEVSVGKIEVMSLLRAMLISKTVLTDVFKCEIMQRRCY